jgi:outer membrane protein TolC
VAQRFGTHIVSAAFVCLTANGCADLGRLRLSHPSVAPAAQPAASLKVDPSQIPTMYRQMLAVDLPTVARVAMARNLDIQKAQQRVEASHGAYEASIGAIFPSITPGVSAVGLNGAVANGGGFGLASFQNFFPLVALQWIINPGQVAYDLVASKRRLEASAQQQQAVEQETTRLAAVQYYDLVLTQAQVAVTREAMDEAEELLRIERLKSRSGTGLPADELRAKAAVAAVQQDALTAIKEFYNASIALTITLHLDSTVMLVPHAGAMAQTTLVREDLPIEDMLVTAVRYRPDLQAVRTLVSAAQADKGATFWGGLGPQVQASSIFRPAPPAGTVADTEYRQQTYVATGGFNLSAQIFGRIKTATANAKLAGLDLDVQLDKVRAAVVSAHQASITAVKLIPIAGQEVVSAEEALRLTQQNLRAGTALTIDVLQAQNAAEKARLRQATAMVRYNQAQINLLAALGLIDQTNLEDQPTAAPVLGAQVEPSGSPGNQ